ncbi:MULTISPECIES: tyrosine-type recombinase/integrase [Paraburkholderia]|uniref:Tyrosine-type recombinase/integrase n=1 Tax=Paraburkholderia madseniana TaxID=2599607 RepID=A0AAP5BQI7_9BURK|nr:MULTISPECIES: tyrosine-type recombinase/integrase [Paraburkholderia]MCX4152292.1 tyrosine-type recombinase/integrase [Paraburkholderia madseniana]MDN7155221.1 tyrosine-type recombinase/integrase [Paraburkholderia sp. WS6]MDQ6414104.1 tyrosine-type recombinase/integrase [Paraburkholderia madseniana]
MMPAVESYIAARHAAGFKLLNADYLLRSFARFAVDRGETHVHAQTAIDWAAAAASVAQRDARLKTVCRFARYLHIEDQDHEVPPARYFAYRKTRRVPYIYSCTDIECLIDAALKLGPASALKPQTYAALIALLSATGLRVSEALDLRIADVTPDGLVIRKSKFQKTRLVPLHDTTAAGLQKYLTLRRRVRSCDDHAFVDDDGRPLRYTVAYKVFQKLLKIAGISHAPNGRRPRIHELRHSFAVHVLEASPEGRDRVGQHMLALATYLGHVNIKSTYWYLEATPELLRDIAVAAERFLTGDQK